MTLCIPLLCLLLLAGCSRSGSRPLSPEEGLRSIRLSDDFRVELFASEPMVLDPVDMVFDESGRAFVADMLDLPYDPPAGKPARSRIVMIEDTDGDGRADKSTVFAENVLQVSGLMVWNGGLIVPSSPDIYFMKDTDGDGRADIREVLFTGFHHGNPEAQISNPRLAIDNWIYFSNTGNPGRITSPKWPQHPAIEVRGADFRFHPVRQTAGQAAGGAQYGSTFDDWGNRFISQNTQHLRHVVVPMQYLLRAPLLDVPSVNHDPYGKRERLMWPLTQPQQWRVDRTRLRQQRYAEQKSGRIEHVAGHITGASGGTVYTGDAWPENYHGSLFTGDVSGNLVRRDILTPDGVSFAARPAKEDVEFLASTDQWFRPTCFANAPDGNLYLMDMYREIIETPLSIPEELQKRLKLDFYSGDKRGRIYRIVANQPRQRRNLRVSLGKASTEELVRALGHENGWHRQTAQRLLVERQSKDAAPLLRETARKSGKPLARLHAMWTLEGVGALEEADVLAALGDSHPGIREHAVRLTEALPVSVNLEKALLAKVADPEVRVRYQLAFTLGRHSTPAARQAIVDLAARNCDSPWFRIAALSSAADWPADFFSALLRSKDTAWQRKELVGTLGSLIGARHQPAEVGRFLLDTTRLKSPAPALDGLARGLEMSQVTALSVPGADAVLGRLLDASASRAVWNVARRLAVPAIFQRAIGVADDEKASVDQRAAAAGALRGARPETVLPVLKKLLASNAPAVIQAAAIDSLAGFRDAEAAATILAGWKAYPPEARVRAVNAMLAQRERIPLLLDALERGVIETGMIEIHTRNRLLEDNDQAIVLRAKKLFSTAVSDRDKVVAQFRNAINLSGDVARGKNVFEENCAKCHTSRRKGGQVGPDLSGVNNKSKEELLEAILNPSRSIEPRFVNYIVTTRDGRMFDGVLAGESPGAITLRGGSDDDVTILRSQIQEVRASSISLMPEDFEKGLSRQALADVIAYLRAGL
ncbi:MAG: c-type cytochrome [Acidobacteria bacterium]|nr:c-type cytochrome [Acidobacteriota bacterium]